MSQSLAADTPVLDYIKPADVVKTMIETGASKADLSVLNIFVRGMLGGGFLAIATSIAFVGAAQTGIPIVGALLFPVGFICITLLGVDLITGYFALTPLAVIHGRMSFGGMLRAWVVVWAGNLAGSVLYAFLMYGGLSVFGALPAVAPVVAAPPATTSSVAGAPLPPPPILTPAQALMAPDPIGLAEANVVKRIGTFKTLHYEQFGGLGFAAIFVKAMLCNWMVTLGVVLPMASRAAIGKIVATYVPIFMFFAMGYEHMVVNMFIIPAAMFFGAPITMGDFWLGNELPATLGNFAGGFLFTGAALGFVYRTRAA
jgi:formate transporter